MRTVGPPPGSPRIDVRLLELRARRVLAGLGHTRSELSLALVDDERIAALNAAWRDRTQPTDVLSFSLLDGEHAGRRGRLLGDVVIGVEEAARQARRRHRGIDETLAQLLIHGILHLLGHDHECSEDARIMRSEERRLWRMVRA